MDYQDLLNAPPPDMEKVPGGWLADGPKHLNSGEQSHKKLCPELNVFLIKNALSDFACAKINAFMKNAPSFAPVSVQGLQEVTPETTGSFRATMWNPALAKALTEAFTTYHRLSRVFPHNTFPSDWWQGNITDQTYSTESKHWKIWECVGVSPMLRYMKYPKGGKHACHYDAAYIYEGTPFRTLYSFVLYLSTNKTGATRIIYDGQETKPVWDRNHDDWSRDVLPEEVIVESYPVKGNVLIFPHRVPHDVQPYDGAEGDRIIIRGDLIFKGIK
jgi:hypothetical protein